MQDAKSVEVKFTRREARLIKHSIALTTLENLVKVIYAGHENHRTVRFDSSVHINDVIKVITAFQQNNATDRGDKQVGTKLLNTIEDRYVEEKEKEMRIAKQRIEHLKSSIKKFEDAEKGEYFVERRTHGNGEGFTLRAMSMHGKHGDGALAKVYVTMKAKINMGVMTVLFTVSDSRYSVSKNEFKDIKSIEEAEKLATEVLANKVWENGKKIVEKIAEFKDELIKAEERMKMTIAA